MTENRSRGAMDSGDEPRRQTPTATPTATPTLDELLAAAARPASAAPEAEQCAVAAFRAARDAGAPAAPTRRRDDWRPVRRPWIRIPWIKASLGSFVGGLALGGVAMAAGAIPAPFGDTQNRPGPAPSASSPRGETTSPARPVVPGPPTDVPAGPTGHERPPTAKDQLAQCRVYESQQGRGGQLNGTAWRRLEDAAGGPDAVAAYCARLLGEQPLPKPSKERPAKGAKDVDSGTAPRQKPSTSRTD